MTAYIDDIVILLPPAHAKSVTMVEAVATWLREHMKPLGVDLNRQKSHALFPPGTKVDTWTEDALMALEQTQLTITPARVRIVRVPVGHPDYIRRTARDIARG